MKLEKVIILALAMGLIPSLPTFAATLYPNDDVTLRGSTNYNASDPFGLFVKGSGDVSYMEYTLGSLPVTEAKLVLWQGDTGVSNPWTIVVKGDEYNFDEATITSGPGPTWSVVGTFDVTGTTGNPPVQAFYEMDLTTWYNNNLGNTMSLFMTRDVQPAGSGPIFEDKEGTKTGDGLTYSPRITIDTGESPPLIDNLGWFTFEDIGLNLSFDINSNDAPKLTFYDPAPNPFDPLIENNTIFDSSVVRYVAFRLKMINAPANVTFCCYSFHDDPDPLNHYVKTTNVTVPSSDDWQIVRIDLADKESGPGTYTGNRWFRIDVQQTPYSIFTSTQMYIDWISLTNNPTWDGYTRLPTDILWDFTSDPNSANHPSPENEHQNTDPGTDLKWWPGQNAVSHDIYFSTSESAVASASRLAGDINADGPVNVLDASVLTDQWLTSPGDVVPTADLNFSGGVNIADFNLMASDWLQSATSTFMGNQTTTTFNPGPMDIGVTYYWRVDERRPDGQTRGDLLNLTPGITSSEYEIVFPDATWQIKTPAELGLDGTKLDQFANNVGGDGCIVRQGYVVKTWGSQSVKADWASAAKPVTSTMLFFAVEETLLSNVHELIEDHGWNLITKDEPMEFYHLANMTSGYARGEAPGAAWAYNDYAIKLYNKTFFDNVYVTSPNTAATDSNRLGALQFEDGTIFSSRDGYGVYTSVRDFARIGWFWCNYGYWNGTQVLPRWYFDDYMKAHVSSGLPRTTTAGSDYLGIGTYGGGSDQTADGPGVYGFNWWCNPNQSNWPDAPADTIQANGHWGKEVVTVIPSLSLVVAYRTVNARGHTTGSSSSDMNQDLKLLVEACPEFPLGQIVVDDAHPGRMVYHATFENGREKPVCFAGPGDPEDFFYNDTTNNLNLLTGRGARCTYITAVLQDFGGGNPGSGAALDAKLDEWEGYITQLENAGIITVFFFFDDSQPLTPNWQELVDKSVAKFKHHKLLIWSVAEEYQEALSAAQVSQVAARIKQQDNYNHIVGVHQLGGNTFDFLADSNIDMFLMQLNYSTPGDLHNMVKNSNANGQKILNMAEAADHAKQTRQTVRLWNWASIMGGASAVQVLWMGRASDPADWNDPDKYDDCARLMDFMESTRINETSNRDDLTRGNTDYVLANPGQVYIAYGDSGSSLGLNVQAGTYREKWFDPVDGDWVDQGSQVLSADDQSFIKPGAIGSEAAIYLEVE